MFESYNGLFMQSCSNSDEWIRNTFGIQEHTLVDGDLNKRLISILDLSNNSSARFNTEVNEVLELLGSSTLCKYQDRLLRFYFENPEKYLSVDCDRITFTADCTERDVKSIVKKIGRSEIPRIYKTRCSSLSVEKCKLGTINKGWRKKADVKKSRPYYSHAFRIIFDSKLRKSLYLYVADGTHKDNGKIGIRIDFVPSAFSTEEVYIIFSHLSKRLGKYRFLQILHSARLTRVDFGVNIPGICSVFLFAYSKVKKEIDSKCFPEGQNLLKETTYYGNTENSNHWILYEKLLKEAKSYQAVVSNINDLAVTSRIEYRYFPYRSKKKLLLQDMPLVRVNVSNINFLSPKHLHLVSKDLIMSMLFDKTQERVKAAKKDVKAELREKDKKLKLYSLNNEWMEKEKIVIAQSYLRAIMNSAQ